MPASPGPRGLQGVVARTMDELTAALDNAVEDQMKNGKTTLIEAMLNQELGEPFRRDAMKKPVQVAGRVGRRHGGIATGLIAAIPAVGWADRPPYGCGRSRSVLLPEGRAPTKLSKSAGSSKVQFAINGSIAARI